ncbi:MAG: hypothetical protein CM15mP91_2060 [Chloroflexota bacterium]|nr:MAG: hypothetical protein CM15mP91_2060 [Chloroflexota bacterium]
MPIHSWLIKDTKFEIGRKYAVDPYEEHKKVSKNN